MAFKKSDNLTPQNVFLGMLAQIPSVGVTKAKAITEHYRTMDELMSAFRDPSLRSKHSEMLAKQVDGVGKAISRKIHAALFGAAQ